MKLTCADCDGCIGGAVWNGLLSVRPKLGTLANGMRNRRVLHIASGDLWAGAEVQIYLLLKALACRDEVSLKVVLMNDGELRRRLTDCGLEVEVIEEGRLAPHRIVARLCSIVQEFQPEIIHTHRYKENLLGQLANAFSGGAEVVRTAHGRSESAMSRVSFTRRLIARADEIVGKRATACTIAVSNDLAQWLRQNEWPNVRCIPNGIDVDAVQRHQEIPAFLRRSGDRPVIGFVGRLEPVKRADLFVEIAEQAVRDGWCADWHLFGDGSGRASLQARVKEIGLGQVVHFHGHRTEVVSWLGSLDVLVMTSDHEGMPMVLLEALAAGTPVVGHAVGGIREVLSAIEGSALVYEQAAGSYLRAIQASLSCPSSRTVEAGRRLVRDRYSVDRVVEETLSTYATVLRV